MTSSRTPLFALLLVGLSLALPHLAHAAIPYFGPIIPTGNLQSCAIGWGGLILVANSIISFLITIALVFVAPLSFAYAGFLYVLAPTSAGDRSKANGVMVNTVVGIVIVLAAYLIVGAVLGIFYSASVNGGTPWYSLITSGGQDPCLNVASSLSPSGGATSPTSQTSGIDNSLCAGNLICGTSGTCQVDPSGIDNTTGAAGQPCNPAAPNCTNGLSCDNTDTCSASGTSDGVGLGGSCVTSGGGTCTVQSSGSCSASNMGAFGAAAQQASQICSAETANGVLLQGDKISGGPSSGQPVSFGLFQINITTHQVAGLNCPSAFDSAFTGSHKNVTITNQSLYTQCVNAALDPATNIATAQGIYQNDGDSFHEWSTHTKCGLALLDSVPVLAQACEIISTYE